MRAILIDWLVEVHLKFKLVPETLYLTVNLIDRYLLGSPVERSNLQLVGVSALLLASKYEEIYPPELKDLVYITDKAYTQEQILGMEEKMVKALKYKMTIASVHCFMMRYLKAGHADRRMVWLASYVAERMLQEYSMLKYLPSMVAACAVYVARKNLGRNVEPDAAPLRAVRRERPARLPQGHARRPPLDEGLARGREEEVLVGEVRHGRDDAAQGPGLSRRRLCVF